MPVRDATILINGEKRDGKEVLAQAAHTRQPTQVNGRSSPLTAAMAPQILESELFAMSPAHLPARRRERQNRPV